MNSGIPSDESRFKERELQGFIFYLFQLMIDNESDHRAIVEAEGFMDPFIRSVVSGLARYCDFDYTSTSLLPLSP